MGFVDARARGGGVLRLGGFRGRGHCRVPVEEAAATVAAEQLAFAKLIPHLGSNAHAAPGALLIVDAGQAGAAGAGETVIPSEPLRLDEGTERFALGVEGGQPGGVLLMAHGDSGAGPL